MSLDLAIVVPSRKRAHNMPLIRELLPSAVVCIDERETLDYAGTIDERMLLPHPPMEIAARVRNWIVENVATPIVVMIDDDFQGIQANTGDRRFITDSEEILAIIENAARACQDLDLTTFCWSGTQNTTIIHPDMRPFVPTQPVFRAFGIMGAARRRRWRTDLPGRADLDWTLRTLLLDRCVCADVRFFFDCGAVFAGRGGNVGLVTPENFDASSRELRRTWGNSVSFIAPAYVKKREVASVSLRVSRSNKTAQR